MKRPKKKSVLKTVVKASGEQNEHARRLDIVIRDSNDAITIQDLEGKILAWNRAAERIYGYSESEALGANIDLIIPGSLRDQKSWILDRIRRDKKIELVETKRATKDGRIIDISLTVTKLTDAAGSFNAIATTERDVTEKNHADAAMKRLATIVRDSNDAIKVEDFAGRILAWNRGAEAIYGFSEAEALRMNVDTLLPDDRRVEFRRVMAAIQRGEDLPSFESQRRTKDGRIVDVQLTVTKVLDADGTVVAAATTARDITARKRADAELREKARELEFLRDGQLGLVDRLRGELTPIQIGDNVLGHLVPFLGAQMGAFYLTTEGGTLRRAAGYAGRKFTPEEAEISFGEGLLGQAALSPRALMINDVPESYFGRISSDSGQVSPGSLLFSSIRHEGKIVAVIEIAAFGPANEHQRIFLDHVAESVGVAVAAALGRAALEAALRKAQALGEALQAQQEELQAANEELEAQAHALQDSQARLENQQAELEQSNDQLEEQARTLAQQRDSLDARNGELLASQGELERRTGDLERASRYKSEFLANMSHELRTPLNSSLILAKLLADNSGGNLTPEQIDFANSIYSAGNDLLNLINDILDLSKVEAGKLEIREEPVYLPDVLASLRGTFAHAAATKGIKLAVGAADDVADAFATDRLRLEQILKNLMSNALKFTAAGEVSLTVANGAGKTLRFAVRDSGIGIAPAQQQVIFEAFRQADGTTNRKYGGTGLGLSISRDLARLLGGTVEVASVPDEGSCFTLVLPQARVGVEPATSARELAAGPSRGGEQSTPPPPKPVTIADDREKMHDGAPSLLIIEDDPQFARVLYELGRELKYQCVVAPVAGEGLELARAFRPHAILLDMNLPDQSGLAVLDALKEDSLTRHIPVHIMSAHDFSEKALQMGAVGYMLKPAKREEIKEAFARLEKKFAGHLRRVLVVEDDRVQREGIARLIAAPEVEITSVALAREALDKMAETEFDCVIMDLKLPDMRGDQLLELMCRGRKTLPPVIVYTGRSLTREEEEGLRKYSRSIILKGAKSPERLLDEVTLFLHQVESAISPEKQNMLKAVRSRETAFEDRVILVVDDDIRNVFALTAALESQGATIEVARNGVEALEKLEALPHVDLVLMDVMMPEMDGYEATRRIRALKRFQRLPIIAVTAKATKDDQRISMQAGANDYLAKPIDLNRLFSLVRVWMPRLGR